MKKLIATIKRRWKSKTPQLVVMLQVLLSGISAMPAYYSLLPEEFKTTVPATFLLYISISGMLLTGLLQLITKKKIA